MRASIEGVLHCVHVLIDHEGIVRETRSGWSSSIDGWLDSTVNKYLKAIPE